MILGKKKAARQSWAMVESPRVEEFGNRATGSVVEREKLALGCANQPVPSSLKGWLAHSGHGACKWRCASGDMWLAEALRVRAKPKLAHLEGVHPHYLLGCGEASAIGTCG